jgi:hypothetical protein
MFSVIILLYTTTLAYYISLQFTLNMISLSLEAILFTFKFSLDLKGKMSFKRKRHKHLFGPKKGVRNSKILIYMSIFSSRNSQPMLFQTTNLTKKKKKKKKKKRKRSSIKVKRYIKSFDSFWCNLCEIDLTCETLHIQKIAEANGNDLSFKTYVQDAD